MTLITLRILDGPQRGVIYNQVMLPVTIGREEGNVIRLTDERVSRYHIKIHEQDKSLLLSDLQSTNGTRVNGEVVSSWVLRPGDLIFLGRSTLLFGAADEIAVRLQQLRISREKATSSVPLEVVPDTLASIKNALTGENIGSSSASSKSASVPLLDREIFRGMSPEDWALLYRLPPPSLPSQLTAKQSAQLAELLQYLLLRLRYLVGSIKPAAGGASGVSQHVAAGAAASGIASHGGSTQQNQPATAVPSGDGVNLQMAQWQNLLDLYSRIALYLRAMDEHRL
ncbi:MAG: FHA domain-containing protein [Thermoguttaceae bacterium]